MNLDYIIVALAATSATSLVSWALWSKDRRTIGLKIKTHYSEIRELEKKVHLRERDFLEERNQLEIAKSEAVRLATATGFEEGRLLGQAEKQRDHLTELTNQRVEYSNSLIRQCEIAGVEARDRLRAEYELQTKLFTVKICPYLKIIEDKSIFNKKHDLVSGYQYQLLINGIPAFSPHIVPERIETKSEINPELEKTLLSVAEKAADAAINLYLGGNTQFAKLFPAVIDRGTK